MMSDNLNRDFFRGEVSLETETKRADGKIIVEQKGTIRLLDDWFSTRMRFPDPTPFEEAIDSFKKVRKLRRIPAHKIEDSVFDQEFFKEQRELIVEAYTAVRTIRLMLANHPSVQGYEVEEQLFKGQIWDR